MKLLFLTAYNVPIYSEHFFTINVWEGLCEQFKQRTDEVVLGSIIVRGHQCIENLISEEEWNGKKYYKLYVSSLLSDEEKVLEIARFYRHIAPDVIHSNMSGIVDVMAAKRCDIPIVLTIHIGGFICPRGDVHGLMRYNDEICNTTIGKHCFRCCAQDFPLPPLARFLYWCTSTRLREWVYNKLRYKQIFYLTQFLVKSHEIVLRQKAIKTYQYATIIAANQRLKELLALNGLKDNVILLPHGVKPRNRLPFPEIKDVVKFYYLGRIQYAKGLHNLIQAFEGIDKSLYELHIIGDSSESARGRKYKEKIICMAKGLNVVFHGVISNDKLETVIKDMHVMIHSTICLEVYGLTIAESLSIGRLVLATRCGGAEMQIQDGVNGWLVEPNNVTALRNKITEILNHKEQLKKMSGSCNLLHPLAEYIQSLSLLYETLS